MIDSAPAVVLSHYCCLPGLCCTLQNHRVTSTEVTDSFQNLTWRPELGDLQSKNMEPMKTIEPRFAVGPLQARH
jgi:hypothetical protein